MTLITHSELKSIKKRIKKRIKNVDDVSATQSLHQYIKFSPELYKNDIKIYNATVCIMYIISCR